MSNHREHLSAALEGRYRIAGELGAGGMATVYLAEDLKHDRKVAIKVLKPELAAVLGAERFVQEIKTTAALSHPHILPLFDSGEAAGFLYYVMPYLQGETIREKLDRETQFGIAEAVKIATEVAEALDYAHQHGVIHRDIKPENILLHAGRPMVMDFGIALAVSAAAGGRMTETGLSLGTPHYMSPEQATADKQITARSDVYSLASVLYEMLTGDPPHVASSAQAIIMKIIAEPVQPATERRKSVPPHVAAALAKALEKLPADRFATAKDFADALGNPAFTTVGALAAPAAGHGRRRWSGVTLAAFAVGLFGIAAAAWRWLTPVPAITPPMLVQLPFAANDSISGYPYGDAWDWGRPTHNAFAFSPDGRSLLYTGPGGRLFLRALDGRDSTPIAGIEDAESPFFSPDGRSIGYWSAGRLHRVSTSGGPSTEIAAVRRISGASWSERNQIAVGAPGIGLVLISPDGSAPPDTIRGSWALPRFLPGGRSLLVTRIGGITPFESDVYWLPLDSHEPELLIADAADARLVPTGHLVFGRDGTLMAVRFDAGRHEVVGSPFTVLPDVMQAANSGLPQTTTGATQVAFSPVGQLAWLTGGVGPAFTSEALELDRQGHVTVLPDAGRRGFVSVRLSPDEGRLAFGSTGLTSAIEILDLARGTTHTLATRGQQFFGLWSHDGLRVVTTDGPQDSTRIVSLQADGAGSPQAIGPPTPTGGIPAFWSPDGATLYAWRTGRLVAVTVADGTRQAVPNVPRGLYDPTLSPDGEWLAYTATEPRSLEPNVYVSPWPALDRQWKLSSGGAASPAWTRGGRELVFLQELQRDSIGNSHVRVMSVDVSQGPAAASAVPRQLFSAEVLITLGILRSYDVSADGSRFFMVRAVPVHAAPGRFYMMTNGFAEIRRLSAEQEAGR